ncbi:vitamin K epoxide reductase family protein [Agriterribacter sp.]|uniref:vitamin K epoxide reductase family protein n=1 Tax=Agriterribacter sp. TaxID=2821509 RepID=UPI002CD61C7D|nr:vitamin K epoxide reductase family protein [Agriterribacter sp.]HTN08422.1 vitamin K epoxide reductase family protein [Agriterribacter sp.]
MNLTIPQHNCEKTVIRLIRCQKINITDTTIRTSLETHPDYPSLLSISDFLHSYNIENIALKTRVENFAEFPVPFIAHIFRTSANEDIFIIVHEVKGNRIVYEAPDGTSLIREDIDKFSQKFAGHVLLIDASEAKPERDYGIKQKTEHREKIISTLALIAIPVVALAYMISMFFRYPAVTVVFGELFLLLALVGTGVSFLLLLFEIDNHNPLLKEVCRPGKKINCTAVLQSKASGIMGVSWSSIGFCYFSGMLLFLLVLGIDSSQALLVTGSVSVLSLPYIFFSLYYQWKVVKQWCVLCLAIQAILLLQFIVAATGGFYNNLSVAEVSFGTYMATILFFMFPALALYITLPAIKKSKEGVSHYHALQRLKHNRQVFDALLGRQKKIEHPTKELGITIGKPDAKWKIVKVCNPYCGPCAKAHSLIEELISNNEELSVQIIFTATENEKDIKKAPAMHLMSIAANNDETLTNQALSDWYNAPRKDYKAFAEKYAAHTPSEQMNLKIMAMREWCDRVQITVTPSFFVCMNTHNNEDEGAKFFQLPEMYTVADLKYFFTV